MIRKTFGTITSAGILLAVSSVASGALGLVRDRLLAARFGAGPELDAYFAAFRIPDTIYGILVVGGFSAVFMPMLAEYFGKDDAEGWKFVHSVLRLFVVFFACVALVLFVAMPWFMNLVVPGFSEESRNLAVSLSRVLLLSPLILGVSSVFSGVLQYFQ
ncbi:MAG: murein biosynthesis integral membrane protein MurJ, partial [Candidatus Wildermuthbacteria bacterium]|nr:murein biosynthesis integral membrane protein MurJ [Candidatus Wildermuthbacteria bacterium]